MNYFLKVIINLLILVNLADCTIDINLSEFQYLADHLTEEECHKLVAALHFRSFDLSKEINSAERKLPDDVPCIDLLLHWNSTPREGKGQTHIEVCHRLNQIGRKDLAQWLSKTVFHEITNDLKDAINETEAEKLTFSPFYITYFSEVNESLDEAAWWKLDSIISILVILGLLSLVFGSFFLCYIRWLYKESFKGYKKLSANKN